MANIGESIILLIVIAWLTFIMLVVGIFQLKSKEPVGFYTGEKPLKREQVTDVAAWNKKHGLMWISYGIAILLTFIIGMIVGDEKFFGIMFMTVVLGSLPVMIIYHHWLKKKYVK